MSSRTLPLVLTVLSLVWVACTPAPQPQTTADSSKPVAAQPPAKGVEKPDTQAPRRGGTFVGHLRNNPNTLDGQATTGGVFRAVLWSLYDGLIELDEKARPTKNGLLQDWTVASDGLSITFKLRPNVKFHDGTPFDAEAVKFNVERVKDPNTKSVKRADFGPVSSVEVLDSLTVRFSLSRPSPALVEKMGSWGGLVVSPTAVKKYGSDFGLHPVGTGPFEFVEWVPDDHITIKRFEGYWKQGLPYLDQITLKVIPDFSSAVANLRTGNLDEVSLVPEALVQSARQSLAGMQIVRLEGSLLGGLSFNVTEPPFDNKLLRQAVAWAVDRDAVIRAALGQSAQPVFSIYPPASLAHNPSVKAFYPRNVDKAKALLAQAGYPNGLETKLLSANEQPYPAMAQVIQSNLAEAGLKVEIDQVTRPQTIEIGLQRKYKMMIRGALQSHDPDAPSINYFGCKGGQNYTGYCNQEYERLVEQGGQIYDEQKRKQLYGQAEAVLLEDLPFWFFYAELTGTLVSDRVGGYRVYLDNFTRYRDLWVRR